MRLTAAMHTTAGRRLLLAAVIGGGVALAALAWVWGGAAALVLAGVGTVVIAAIVKAVAEIASDTRANRVAMARQDDERQRISDGLAVIQPAVDDLAATQDDERQRISDGLAVIQRAVDDLADQFVVASADQANRNEEIGERLSGLEAALRAQGEWNRDAASKGDSVADAVSKLVALEQRLSPDVADLGTVQRIALKSLRADLDELWWRLASPVTDEDAGRLGATDVGDPLLSIAIPSFNRPDHLERCLASIVAEIEATGSDDVEVHITDDRSTEHRSALVARDYAERYPFIGLHLNDENLGLERNVVRCVEPCRGEFLLVIGSDDSLIPGALAVLLEDLADSGCPVHLYEKTRVDSDGRTVIPPVWGSSPATLASGASQRFETLLEAVGPMGLLSTFGFSSQVVIRRAELVAVDAAPYLGLTMYALLATILEVFSDSCVWYHNVPLVHQRTQSQAEKLAEAIGRREESHMAGGEEKRATNFGPTLGAYLQRIIERSAMTHQDIARLPERLFTKKSLWEWIEENTALAEEAGIRFPDDVARDHRALRSGIEALEGAAGGGD